MSDNEKRKNKFRSSKTWKDFRDYLRKSQKTDPVTGSKLTRRATTHHLDLDINNYEKISEDRQVMLNPETHSVLHYFYGNEKNMHDWRSRIDKIVELCERMDKFNKENKKYVNQEAS